MKRPVSFEFSDTWTPEQMLALYDLCQSISASLWLQHQHILQEQMIKQDQINGHALQISANSDNLELPFEDEIPF